MAKDFRATQVETTKIILSGGIASSTIGGAIYSGSVATNRAGGIPAAMLNDVGTDVFLFVSGTKSNSDFSRSGVTLFGGDVVVSGTMYAERQVIEVDGIVDGDLIVTGNLLVKPDANSPISADFRNVANASLFRVDTSSNTVVINEESNPFSFRVESNNKENAIKVDGSLDKVLILSGGAAASYNEASGLDVNFYVSGSRNSAGTSTKGTSLYGGDLAISGSIRGLTNGFIESGLTVNNAGQGSGADSLIVKGRLTHGNLLTVSPSGDRVLIDGGFADNTDVLDVRGNDQGGNAGRLFNVSPLEVVVNQDNTDHVSLRVATNTKTHALLTNALRDQVLIHSGGSASSYDESTGADVSFYISGSKGSRGSMIRGTSVFGGDIAISGSAFTGLLTVEEVDPTITFKEAGVSKGVIGINSSDNIQIENKSTNKHIVFKVNDGGVVREGFRIDGEVAEVVVNQGSEALVDFRVESNNKESAIKVDGSTDKVLILSGGAGASNNEAIATDVNFYVSGTMGSRGSSTLGTSLFGGDHVVSGSTVTLAGVYRSTAFKTNNFNVAPNDHFLFIDSSAGHVTASLQSAATAGKGRELVFKDSAGYAGETNNRIVIKPVVGDKLEGVADETKIEVLSGSISIISDGVGQYFIVGVRD